MVRHNRGQLEARAKTWFVPAWKHAARLSVRTACPASLSSRSFPVPDTAHKTTPRLAGLSSAERKCEGMTADAELCRKRKRESFLLGIELERRLRNRLVVDRSAADFQLRGIQDQLANGRSNFQSNRFRSGEISILLRLVRCGSRTLGHYLLRQLPRCAGKIERFLSVQTTEQTKQDRRTGKQAARAHSATKRPSRFLHLDL